MGRPFDYLCKMIFFLDVDHFKVLVCYHIVSVFFVLIFGWRHVGSNSTARDLTHISCTGKQNLSHWITREVPQSNILNILNVGNKM